MLAISLREAKPGGFQTRGFPTFLGKVQIVSRTLSGLFLVGALNRPRKRKRTNRENPGTIPKQIGKSRKNWESPKKDKRTKKEGQVQIGKPPRLKPPRLAALDLLSRSTGEHLAFEVFQTRGVHLFLPFSHKNAVAHMDWLQIGRQ